MRPLKEHSELSRQVAEHPLLDRQKFLSLHPYEQDNILKAILRDMAKTRSADELKATLGLLQSVIELGRLNNA